MIIHAPQLTTSPRRAGWLRLSADVEYRTLKPEHEQYWFEVPQELEALLSRTGDPWLAAGLPLAAALGEPLAIEAPVDPVLAGGAEEILRIWHAWELIPAPRELLLDTHASGGDQSLDRTATFFSGGVHSFFSLLHSREQPGPYGPAEAAVFIHGYDIAVDNVPSFSRAWQNARRATDELGVELIPLATNARETAWHLADWARLSHGPLLAASGPCPRRRLRPAAGPSLVDTPPAATLRIAP